MTMVIGAAVGTGIVGLISGNKADKANKRAIDAQSHIAEQELALSKEQQQMSKDQFEYYKTRQVGIDATAKQVADAQLEQMSETTEQGRDLFNYQKEVFRPVEQSLVSQAMRESTPEYYEKFAQEAVTRQASAQANAQAQTERVMASMGINPNSGAYASNQRGLQLANAAGLGAVANESRDKAENLGWARKADVAGIGKGLVGAGNASYGLATNAGNSAVGAATNANASAIAGMGSAPQYAGLAQQGMSNASRSFGSIIDATGRQVAAANQATSDLGAGLGRLVGGNFLKLTGGL